MFTEYDNTRLAQDAWTALWIQRDSLFREWKVTQEEAFFDAYIEVEAEMFIFRVFWQNAGNSLS